MAKEISELVEAQSEVVDKIVSNIDITHDYGEKRVIRSVHFPATRGVVSLPRAAQVGVCRSPDHPFAVQRGEKSLERGLEAMRAARRRMCCLIIIVVVILVIISGVLGGVLGGA